jgi:Chaperone of endosialidase
MKVSLFSILSAVTFSCLAVTPNAKAVIPAPDGGYPGGNTAEGQNALLSLTTGRYNTAIGFFCLRSNGASGFNTAIGAGALLANNTATANENTATGAAALLSNTIGTQNTANGAFALVSNTTGAVNTATGEGALFSNTTANYNTADGCQALYANTTGGGNTASGYQALYNNTTGFLNTAVGAVALAANATGHDNTAVGESALFSNVNGYENTAVGSGALIAETGLFGIANTAIGYQALFSNNDGIANAAVGDSALQNNTVGSQNTAIGAFAGSNVTTANKVICIGDEVAGANVDNSCFIGSIRDATTQNNDAIPVYIDSAGQLGTASSSRRYKTDIKPMDKTSEGILALKPVRFRYKMHKDSTPQYGLIAEEVAEVNPDLVIYDRDGKPYTVRYDSVNAMLLNEFLKEHRAFVEEQRKVQNLEAAVAKLAATLKEQATQTHKVNAQVKLAESASLTMAADR